MTKLKFSFFALTFILLLSGSAFAQKGSWYIGGQGGYNSKTEKQTGSTEFKNNEWTFAPEVGTFLKDNLQLGVAVNLSGNKMEFGNADSTVTKFSPVVYLRRFFKVSENFSTFVGVVGNYTTGSTKANDVKYDLSGYGANLSLGAAYALSSRFTAVGQYGFLGYKTTKTSIGDFENEVSDLGFNVNSLGPVFNIGIYYTFKK